MQTQWHIDNQSCASPYSCERDTVSHLKTMGGSLDPTGRSGFSKGFIGAPKPHWADFENTQQSTALVYNSWQLMSWRYDENILKIDQVLPFGPFSVLSTRCPRSSWAAELSLCAGFSSEASAMKVLSAWSHPRAQEEGSRLPSRSSVTPWCSFTRQYLPDTSQIFPGFSPGWSHGPTLELKADVFHRSCLVPLPSGREHGQRNWLLLWVWFTRMF